MSKFIRVGDLARSIAKDAIMRAYQNGVLSKAEAIKLIAEMGLKKS